MAKGKGGFIGQDGLNAPDAPTGVSGTAGDTQVTVSWTAPSDVGGSAITGYSVQANDGTNWYYAYDLELASYDSKSFTVSSQTGNVPTEVIFKTDGTKMYVQSRDNNAIYQYSLSTAWDVSTASYDSVSFSTSSQASNPYGFYIKPDGTKMYVCCINNERIYQYSLSTAWDISSASYDSVSFQVLSQTGAAFSVEFKTDGSKMYVIGGDNDSIFQYSLSTEWDLSTASYDSISFDPASQTSQLFDAQFKPDGTKLYLLGDASVVYQYSLSTPWSLSSVSYDSISFSMSSQDSSGYGLFFGNEGGNLYLLGLGSDAVFQYTTGSGADYPTASPVTIYGLTNGTSYTFNVWAINAFGWSSPSDASGSVTPVQPPIGIFAGGTGPVNTIEQFITTTNNSISDFGDLTQATSEMAGCSSSTRGVFAGGNSTVQENTIQYITMRSAGNASDFGDLTNGARSLMNTNGASSETRGLFVGGANSSYQAVTHMDYITIATTGNSSDFGDLNLGIRSGGGAGSPTRAVWGGGESGGSAVNNIQYRTIATLGNASDFGDLTVNRSNVTAASSDTRQLFFGGIDGASRYNTIDYVTIASTGNATDFGDLNEAKFQSAGTSDNTTAFCGGGRNASNNDLTSVQKVTIASTGNSSYFANLTSATRNLSACSTGHGGLQ